MTYPFIYLKRSTKNLFAILLLTLFFLSACAQNQVTYHQTYTYYGPEGWVTDHTPGEHVDVVWKTKPGPPSAEPQAAKVLLSVEFIGGPFRTIDEFLANIRKSQAAHDTFPQSAILVSAQPIQTDNWMQQTFTSSLTLPKNLKPGYYDLFYTVTTTVPGKLATIERNDGIFRITQSSPPK